MIDAIERYRQLRHRVDLLSGRLQVSVSFCPKNFRQAPPEEVDFGPDNTLGLDGLNEELMDINVRYMQESRKSGGRSFARVPLRQLRADLKARATPP